MGIDRAHDLSLFILARNGVRLEVRMECKVDSHLLLVESFSIVIIELLSTVSQQKNFSLVMRVLLIDQLLVGSLHLWCACVIDDSLVC